MAETLISPGVLARENDQSQITSQPVQAGAAIVGPTVLGKKGVPKLVTSYSEYLANFGSTFSSGSDTFTYFTSVSAYNYFNNGGTSLLVTRVNSGSFSPASSSLIPASEAESGALTVGASILGSLSSGGSGGAAAAYNDKDLATVTGTGTGAKADIVVSTSNGKLLTAVDDLLSEFQAGTNPTNAGTAQYTNVILTQGAVNNARATVDVTGTTAPTITGITVTNVGSGYAAGNIDIAAGALGTGQLINAQNVLSISALTGGTTLGNVTGPFTIAVSSVTGGSQQTGAGGTITVTGDGAGALAAVSVAAIGTNYVASNVLKITAADLVTAGFIACDQDLDITLAAANVQDSSAAQATITAANLLTEVTAATVDTAGSGYVIGDQVQVVAADLGGGSATNAVFTLVAADITDSNVFTLETISQGTIMNSSGTEGANGALTNGTRDNIRWEIQAPNTGSGTFSVIVRQGNDNSKSKSILEIFPNVSLDPKQSNYVARIIGDFTENLIGAGTSDPYIQTTGSFRNASRFVRVKSVNLKTPDYFDNDGIAKAEYTGSIPSAASGTFGNADGAIVAANQNYYQDVNNSDSQGVDSNSIADYTDAFNLLANKDDYRYNILSAPGLIYSNGTHATPLNVGIQNVQGRGDAIFILDLENYGSTVTAATGTAASVDNSYAASYWPWLQLADPDSRQLVWVPASTLMPGVYAFNDKSAEAWFAPAGINRGGLSTVVQAERKLTQTNRDDLYTGKVNPIATFPGRGVVVFGQKTLQSQASALDRVNVRRLLIELKSYISQIADNLVFEQNTAATRNGFLAQVNPYLESVQQRQGLYAFKVVMDASNNGPDVIDRNQMVGAIYLQPTKTAEFIYLDFNILPTGAEFPS
jgi:phage tail sheath protein FI